MCQNGSVHPSHCTGAPGLKRAPSTFHWNAWCVGRSVARSVARSVSRAVGTSVVRSTSRLVDRSVGRSIGGAQTSRGMAVALAGSPWRLLASKFAVASVTPANSVLARLAAQSCIHRRSLQGPSRVFIIWLAEMGVASHNSMAKTAAEA